MVEDIRLQCADNGYVISYTERAKPVGGGDMCQSIYHYKQEVFSDAEAKKCWARFNELHGKEVMEETAENKM